MKQSVLYCVVLMACVCSFRAFANDLLADDRLPVYQKGESVSGNLLSVGSDTLAGVMSLWVEAFHNYYPNVNAQVQASGSSTAPPALIQGTAQFGPMSRPMRKSEIEAFEQAYGYKPTELRVAIDAIGLFVQKDNPVQGLNFEQIDAIFSATLRCGAVHKIESWSQLGIQSRWARRSIQLFGRNAVSGTYGYFKSHALCGGDFNAQVNEQPGSASVVQSVASSINAIGYSGAGYSVSGVKRIPVARTGNHYIYPTRQNILSGQYPLSRFLYLYVNKNPARSLSPVEQAFIRFIFSNQGQLLVARDGYIPVSAGIARKELAKVGL
ncbi:Phosphate-binding protein PstS precursor [Vibrio aerogenes CECT 7868]|uniref:Phosphate-binding protein n=2 Tax=Vibrio aerogenes TaxID=92172 RepID=A0A1M5YYS5_9VIBR|nr:Phosphate-binding protein PstS precursor [Vibrio aerogenes CECT 7868]